MTGNQRRAEAREVEIIEAYLTQLARTGSEETVRVRREMLYRLNRELPFGVGQVSPGELSTWLYREDWKQNTKATYYRGLSSFYGWAADPADPWLSANPMAGLPRIRTADSVARACTDEQLRKILTEAAEPFRTWATLAAYQGLRAVEISRLDKEHVTDRQLFVVKGKGGKPRVHDTDPAVWQVVKEMPPGPVAVDPRTGDRATPFYVSMYSRNYFVRVLKVPVSLHKMRHWLGTTVQREYRDIRVTQAVLGHRQLSSTQIYTDATDEQQRAARATLPRFS